MDIIKDKYYEWTKFYDWALEQSDPRVKDWFLMGSYTPTLAITALYVMLVYAGKWWMEKREAYKLQMAVFYYNIGLVILNFYIFYQTLVNTFRAGYSYICQPVVYSNDEYELNIAKALWWFYFSKCIEMMDTFFFVLKKKNNQISFLHVYHHATMFPIWWIGIKWVAGGQSFFGAMVNSFIHVIMYTYYGISALGPQYQKYLWWKRYLTMLQLTQFYIGMVYALSSLYHDCDFPKWMQYFGLFYGVTIIALFLNFYIQEYIKKHNEKYRKIQFVTGIIHAAQSLVFKCDFPEWMHWALVIYAFTILLLFLNFYFHAYVKSMKKKKHADGSVTNGTTGQNGKHTNGHVETKKSK